MPLLLRRPEARMGSEMRANDAKKLKDLEALKDAMADFAHYPDEWKQMVTDGQCGWLLANLWLHLQQAG